jgi:hypothetical protein
VTSRCLALLSATITAMTILLATEAFAADVPCNRQKCPNRDQKRVVKTSCYRFTLHLIRRCAHPFFLLM